MGSAQWLFTYVNPFRNLFPNLDLSAELNHCEREPNSNNNAIRDFDDWVAKPAIIPKYVKEKIDIGKEIICSL